MELIEVTKEKIVLSLSQEEVAFLCNAIAESLHAIDDWEFQTRTGHSPKQAEEMRVQLAQFLCQADLL